MNLYPFSFKRFTHRYRHLIALAVYAMLGVAVTALAVFGVYTAIANYAQSEARIQQAEAQTAQVMAVLNGQVQMVEDGAKYGQVAEVKWHVVELIR